MLPSAAAEWAKQFTESDGFALWVRGEATTVYLNGLLASEFDAYARQQVEAALAQCGKENCLGWKLADHTHWVTEEAAQARVEAALDHAVAIQRKCEQYWNEHGVSDAEYHAALGFIYQEAAAIRALKP